MEQSLKSLAQTEIRQRATKVDLRGGRFAKTEDSAPHRAAARALFEIRPGVTVALISKQTGIPEGTLRRWKSESAAAGQPWQPANHRMPQLAGIAGELANTFKVRMSELGKPLDDKVAAREAEVELSSQHAIDIRARVLERHRREWSAPRRVIYEAARLGDYERAKLAKIMAETLTLIQRGECRVFGLDEAARSADAEGIWVVVERQGSPDKNLL